MKTSLRSIILLALNILGSTVWLTSPLYALEITLPQETAAFTPNSLPGYALINRNCLICHSAQYVQFQPPSSRRPYWHSIVKKMQSTFGAKFSDEEVSPMIEYLVKTYGTE